MNSVGAILRGAFEISFNTTTVGPTQLSIQKVSLKQQLLS
jgi:hypothetical protein